MVIRGLALGMLLLSLLGCGNSVVDAVNDAIPDSGDVGNGDAGNGSLSLSGGDTTASFLGSTFVPERPGAATNTQDGVLQSVAWIELQPTRMIAGNVWVLLDGTGRPYMVTLSKSRNLADATPESMIYAAACLAAFSGACPAGDAEALSRIAINTSQREVSFNEVTLNPSLDVPDNMATSPVTINGTLGYEVISTN